MMNVLIHILPVRPAGTRTLSFSFMASILLLLLVILFPQLDAYTFPLSRTCTSRIKTEQQRLPLCMFQQQQKNDKSRIILRSEERSAGSSDDSPKKKRRRKQSPNTSSAPGPEGKIASSGDFNDTLDQGTILVNQEPRMNADLAMMNEIAKFEFQNKQQDDVTTNLLEPQQQSTSSSAVSGVILLPDIKEARKRKQMEEEVARIQQQQDEQKVKIKRTDKEAFRRVSLLLVFVRCIP